jgi:hypothetical protein
VSGVRKSTRWRARRREANRPPSLDQYIETDISTGRKTRELLGHDFTPSPDGKLVAHVGWIVHFAPPYAQSNYLQVEHRTIYPLPAGMRRVEQVGLTEPPKVVRQEGQIYRGIHGFQHGLSGSPDSQRIALIDCTYGWTPNREGVVRLRLSLRPASLSSSLWKQILLTFTRRACHAARRKSQHPDGFSSPVGPPRPLWPYGFE